MTNYKIAPEYLNGTKEIRLSEGHIYKNNGSYRVEFHCCGIKAKTKTFKKLEDAEEYLNKWINIRNSFCDNSMIRQRTLEENAAGIQAILSGEEPKLEMDLFDKDALFEDFCKAYIDNILIPQNIHEQVNKGLSPEHYPRRVSDTMSIYNCHIKGSAIGATPLSMLTKRDFYLFVKSLSNGHKYKTVSNIMQFCSQIMNHAKENMLIEHNWANSKTTKQFLLSFYYSNKKTTYPVNLTSAYTTEESEKLIKAAKCRNLVLGVLIQYLTQTGARRGEALGLKFSDIDFEKKQIFICRNVSRRMNVKAPADGSGRKTEVVCERALKTLCSTRYIDVDDDILNALSDLREYQINEMGIEKPEFCFVTPDGKFFSPDRVRNFMKASVADAGIRKLTVHELRHTYATNLFHDTKDIYYVSKQLGHTNINTTRRYIEQFQD